ncbi:NAD(P)/FAD-dependent oxidoreductase [Pseudomonas sp. CC120222-01a]|uniref:NAD(P)/FAD-dependent oxidoreductase n=1 Tax=Pseudomonas sp. CC120222-01a TaxID=1378075 RepID=UPI000D8B4B23|nr:FAD-dependent oxidoreductase [Pseudomonas sp. CC120222-01a]PVZ36895.1 anthranilate 1,2-dioxygenase ferredoxin reductase subunit [Pseudomonas sp. CC120222-01a]
MEQFVIVGGGPAAHQAARSILQGRPLARLSLVSNEARLPYDRPDLSKGFMAGNAALPALLAGEGLYSEPRVEWMGGTSVGEIDRRAACVRLDNGVSLGYDKLVIATGSRIRPFSGEVAQAPVHYLRTFEDARALRSLLVDQARVVIIGGGFIGLEVAAAARKRGCRVTVIEAQAQLLARTGCAVLSRWARTLHAENGVDVLLHVKVDAIEPGPSGNTLVQTSAGPVHADVVVVGIGVQPNTELAQACGLDVDDGILVDSACATRDPAIFAAGEVTRYTVTQLGVRTRSESWTAAGEQGSVAGRAAAGDAAAAYGEMPWLWSDQYSSTLQCLGIPQLADKYACLGDPDANQWLALGWSLDDRLVCAIGANRNRDISAIRRGMKRNEPLADIYASALASAQSLSMESVV